MKPEQFDVFDHEGEKVAAALATFTQGFREDGELEWSMDAVQVVFVWAEFFKWNLAGEALALGIGEVSVRIGHQAEGGWRCCRPRSIHKNIAKYAALILRREAERDDRKQQRLEGDAQLRRWREEGEDPFKEDDEP